MGIWGGDCHDAATSQGVLRVSGSRMREGSTLSESPEEAWGLSRIWTLGLQT